MGVGAVGTGMGEAWVCLSVSNVGFWPGFRPGFGLSGIGSSLINICIDRPECKRRKKK